MREKPNQIQIKIKCLQIIIKILNYHSCVQLNYRLGLIKPNHTEQQLTSIVLKMKTVSSEFPSVED